MPAIILLALLDPEAFLQEAAPDAGDRPFHSPGRLVCSACHAETGRGRGAPAADVNRACLSCHDTAGVRATELHAGSTAPKVAGSVRHELPGGLFNPGAPSKGHTLAGWPGALAVAPGGSFPSSGLSCASCHDPHGDGFAFRSLRRRVNFADVGSTVAGTAADRAALVRPGRFADANVAPGASNHNVYRGDMSAWCGACHPAFHGAETRGFDGGWARHPTGVSLTRKLADNYGPLSDFAVPVETASTAARPGAEWPLVAGESKVFCLSCHKAHGSAHPDALRWDPAAGSGGTDGRRGKCGKCHNL